MDEKVLQEERNSSLLEAEECAFEKNNECYVSSILSVP